MPDTSLPKALLLSLIVLLILGIGAWQYSEYTQRQKQPIREVQDYLQRLGYKVVQDGVLSPRTKAAIRGFEQQQQMLETGSIDTLLIEALHSVYQQQDQEAWDKATKTHTQQSYAKYQQSHSKGSHLQQVHGALASVKEAQAQAKAAQAQAKAQAAKQKQLIQRIQSELKRLGFNLGTESGTAGRRTLNAINAYQRYTQQKASGVISQSLLTRLEQADREEIAQVKAQADEALTGKMIAIPGGTFSMGSSNGHRDEKPIHPVRINGFKMSQTEVTFAQWDACVSAGGCSHNRMDKGWGRGNRPVIYVSYKDITEQYIPWLNRQTGEVYRLPTEAEWEYAARAGSTTKYSWGNSINCSQARYGYYSDECANQKLTAPVKSFKANAFGLYDMHGNVWEWTADCWNKSYHGAPSDGRAWTTGDCALRVLRGGSWVNVPGYLRSANRDRGPSSNRFFTYGFRLVQGR